MHLVSKLKKFSIVIIPLITKIFAIEPPNIVIIYTDDQGYGDLSAWNKNSKFQTPNIDSLAKEGISFKHGHSPAPICSPSRYGILTGRYPWRTQINAGNPKVDGPCMITKNQTTLATFLKKQNYNTAIVGKWHLGMEIPGTIGNRDWSKEIRDMPLDKGFDYFWGIPGSLNYGVLAWFERRYAFNPPTLYTNKKINHYHNVKERIKDYRIKPPYATSKNLPKNQEYTKPIGFEVASDFVDNQCLTKFTEKSIQWIQSVLEDTKNNKPFFLYLPYTSPHYPVCPLPKFQGKGKAGPYGEFLIETDHHIGTILKFLKNNNLEHNTLVVFTSDNGPEVAWKSRLDTYNHDSRGGLREGKRSAYEGGHRVPFIIRWPAGLKAPGRAWNKPVNQTDLLATFAELLNVQLTETQGVDSHSFAQVLTDPTYDYERVPMINYQVGKGVYSITEGDWKLIISKNSTELYNLTSDIAESTNLAAQHNELVNTLTDKLKKIIVAGRSTPGKAQPNIKNYWPGTPWFSIKEYERLSKLSKD